MTTGQLRIGLAGGAGYGSAHRENLRRLAAAERAELAGVADPAGRPEDLEPEIASYDSLAELLADRACDVVIVASPIHTHAQLAELALQSGAHVYLEKPPVASWGQFTRLLKIVEASGLCCQVGFQALGSDALPRISELVRSAAVGQPRLITGIGVWSRTRAYFDRSAWSGRRYLDGQPVADGVATNALAHAVAQALRIAGTDDIAQITSIRTELYKANLANESDDTSWIRMDAADKLPISCALTFCGPGNDQPPRVAVLGDRGRLELEYTTDRLHITRDGAVETEQHGRTDLLENLCDHLVDGTPLISPLAGHGPYMRVLEAIQSSDPVPVTEHVTVAGSGPGAHPVIEDIDHWAAQAAESGKGFAAAGAPWATPDAVATWTPTGW